ncbi:hypothetical protein ACOMHN_018024 [Nucella lapillus]
MLEEGSRRYLARKGGSRWRTLVPEGLQTLWQRVSSGPKQCKPRDKGRSKDKHSGVGKEIGLLYGGSLILNTIIGPGIFTSPKGVLAGAGSVGMSLVIWGVCGVFSTMAALCFAELRESVRKEGVEYAYITEAFGPLAGFVYCWMRIAAAEPVGTAVFAAALADYIADSIYDNCGSPELLRKSIAILAVVSLALLNVFSQKLADRMQVLAYVGKTSAIGVLIFFGLKRIVEGKTEQLQHPFANTVNNPTSLTFAFYNGLWAYGGWSNVNHVTSGLKKPPRNLPRLVKFVIPLVMLIYGLVVTSYFTVMSSEDMLASEAIGVTWAERVLQGEAMAIIPIGVGLTALGSLNATFLSAGRLSGVAVKDKQMPEVASWIHVRSKTPILTVYTRLVIATIMILVAEISELVRFFIFSVWLFHGMSVLALLVLRFKDKDKVRPYKVNLILPVIVVVVIAFLLIAPFLETPKPEFIISLVLIGLSLLSYLPSHWVQSRASLPDKFVVWLQLFFRIAPKRRIQRHRSLTEADLKRGRSGSRVAWLETGQAGSPAIVRRRNSRQAQSFGAGDRRRSRLMSVPNVKFFISSEAGNESSTDPIALTTASKAVYSNTNTLQVPNGSPTPATNNGYRMGVPYSVSRNKFNVPSNGSTNRLNLPSSASANKLNAPHNPSNNKLNAPHSASSNKVNAPHSSSSNKLNAASTSIFSRPAGPSILTTTAAVTPFHGSAFIATSSLPPGILSGSLTSLCSEDGGSGGPMGGYLNKAFNGSTQSLPVSMLPSVPSPILEESFQDSSPPDDLSQHGSEGNLTLVGEFESDDGGQYEILTLPQLPRNGFGGEGSDSDSTSSSSDDDTIRGLGSLFDSSTLSDSSDTDEEGTVSDRQGAYVSYDFDSDLDDIIFANLDDRTATFI